MARVQFQVDSKGATTAVVVPDLLFVGRDRASIVTDRGVEGAPDLIVEILSPGPERRDRVEEAQLFARHGVTHYWLVEPPRPSTAPSDDSPPDQARRPRGHGPQGNFVPTLFAGLTIQLASLWS